MIINPDFKPSGKEPGQPVEYDVYAIAMASAGWRPAPVARAEVIPLYSGKEAANHA